MEVEYGLGMQVIVAYMFDSWEGRMAEERGQQTTGCNGDGSLLASWTVIRVVPRLPHRAKWQARAPSNHL